MSSTPVPNPPDGPNGLNATTGTAGSDGTAGRDGRIARLEAEVAELTARLALAEAELTRWRTQAVMSWTDEISPGDPRSLSEVRAELDALQHTLSWRVTRPLRAMRTVQARRQA